MRASPVALALPNAASQTPSEIPPMPIEETGEPAASAAMIREMASAEHNDNIVDGKGCDEFS
jgi:hypothetical protein